jgi:hypothetical protein
MVGKSKFYTIRQSEAFTDQLQQLDSLFSDGQRAWDEVFAAIYWLICSDPYACKIVPGTTSLRIIKTRPFRREEIFYPGFRVFFVIIEDDDIVELLDFDHISL